jgi:SAM-dependent MidA family methyltransferase
VIRYELADVMPSPLLSLILDRIRAEGPLTVAQFVAEALYHETCGYYSREQQRSGREGDFFTAVDLGPSFGELLAAQFAEMWALWRTAGGAADEGRFDLVESAAGNGRLARDILDFAERHDPSFYRALRLHLVERSPSARARQRDVLAAHASRLAGASSDPPERISGVIYANELLDALPPHLVVMREEGLCEVYVDEIRTGGMSGLRTIEGAVSSPRIAEYLGRVGARLQPGWYAEVNLEASDWVRDVARRLDRGFLVLIDYGHEASRLYSASHAAGTLTAYHRHASESREGGPGWLREPGERDITSHVDLTGVVLAGQEAGLRWLGTVDQSYFLLALGLAEGRLEDGGSHPDDIRRRLALKTLLLPGGMGSTHKVIIFSKAIDAPSLRGLSLGGRVT